MTTYYCPFTDKPCSEDCALIINSKTYTQCAIADIATKLGLILNALKKEQ